MHSRHGFGLFLCALVAVFVLTLSARSAFANATLYVVQGSGDIQSLQTSVTVYGPQPTVFEWSTDQAGATGGSWKATRGSPSGPVVAQGDASPAPLPGHISLFTVPDTNQPAFLQNTAPATPVTYYITITPHNAAKAPLGKASSPVSVTEVVQPTINFGPSANLPGVELVHYAENVGAVPNTELLYGVATLTVKAINNSSATTDTVWISILDANAVMRQTSPPVKVGPLKPGQESGPITFKLTANLEAPQSQMPQEKQFADWQKLKDITCGVDLEATVDWAGPQAQTPTGEHALDYVYRGYGSSNSWQENHPVSDQTICDDKVCVSLPQVARNIYNRLACNVVGYAFFVGDQLNGPRGILDAFGQARTSLNPPERLFTPTSRMQIASTSKVLTSLAALKVLASSNFDKSASSFFPGWTLPSNSIVKNITSRQFVSQESGVLSYDAPAVGAGQSDDDASLKAFFTQNLPNPQPPTAKLVCNSAPGTVPIADPAKLASLTPPIQSCYSNVNFAIMRDVLPRAAGTSSTDPQTLADTYVNQVKSNVFAPVGMTDPSCTAGGADALGYNFPATVPGTAFNDTTNGDLRLNCGAWGWWVSVKDYAAVLVSLNAQDGKILAKSCGTGGLYDMVTNPKLPAHAVGWDATSDGTHRWVEKNGGDTWGTSQGSGQVSTSVVLYGGQDGCVPQFRTRTPPPKPVPGVAAVLFINSNLKGSDPAGEFNKPIAGAGPLALSGPFVSGGVAKFEQFHNVVAASTASGDTTQKLTITGRKYSQVISETITLNGTTPVGTSNLYDTVTKIVASGTGYPTAGTISIGTNGIGADTVLLNALQGATTAK